MSGGTEPRAVHGQTKVPVEWLLEGTADMIAVRLGEMVLQAQEQAMYAAAQAGITEGSITAFVIVQATLVEGGIDDE